jgi:hypothetical protein
MKKFQFLTLFSLLAVPAFAVDGVVLINQSIALAGGVTPGDTPGFPVTISVPGSYRLSGNLVVPDANTTAILITADNVTIDLNGFSIIGPNVCSWGPYTCTQPPNYTSGSGIYSVDPLNRTLSISNGTITGMAGTGINVQGGAHIFNVQATSNGFGGISAFDASTIISASTASNNWAAGISTLGAVTGSTAAFNQGDGIDAGTVIANNSAMFNGGNGIFAVAVGLLYLTNGGAGELVNGNVASFNQSAGIGANCPANIVANTATGNAGDNIFTTGSGCQLVNNLAP